jgi:hypothetical protein
MRSVPGSPGASGRRRYRSRYLLLPCVVALASSVTIVVPSLAAESGPSFGLKALDQPPGMSYFVYDAARGSSISGRIRVTNVGSTTGNLLMYGVDGTTAQPSGIVFVDGKEPRRDAGAWIRLGAYRLTLLAGESRVVPFDVTVPAHAKPGQHVGGIVAENLTLSGSPATAVARTPGPNPSSGALVIKIRSLTIVAFQMNIHGALKPGLEVSGVGTGGNQGHQTLVISMADTGNTILKPTGTIDVTNTAGQSVQHQSLVLDSVLSWTSIDYPVLVRTKVLGVGCYQASVAMTYAPEQVANYRGGFCVTKQDLDQVYAGVPALPRPPGTSSRALVLVIIVAAGIVLLMGFLFWILAFRRRRRERLELAVHPAVA